MDDVHIYVQLLIHLHTIVQPPFMQGISPTAGDINAVELARLLAEYYTGIHLCTVYHLLFSQKGIRH